MKYFYLAILALFCSGIFAFNRTGKPNYSLYVSKGFKDYKKYKLSKNEFMQLMASTKLGEEIVSIPDLKCGTNGISVSYNIGYNGVESIYIPCVSNPRLDSKVYISKGAKYYTAEFKNQFFKYYSNIIKKTPQKESVPKNTQKLPINLSHEESLVFKHLVENSTIPELEHKSIQDYLWNSDSSAIAVCFNQQHKNCYVVDQGYTAVINVKGENLGKLGHLRNKYDKVITKPIKWISSNNIYTHKIEFQTQAWRNGQRYTVSETTITENGVYLGR